MRTEFHQFFRPTSAEFERLWKEALIAYDASVLLNFYGYSEEARKDLMDVIRHYAERTRLPYQFALEYARNRIPTIMKQVGNYRATQHDFDQIADQRLRPKREHPFLSEESLQALQSIQQELKDRRAVVEAMVDTDEFMEVLSTVLDGKLGVAPDESTLATLQKEGRARFDEKRPPGYRDANKKASDARPATDPFGDYIAWKQLINIAQAEKKDFILVIDDLKDDWWRIVIDKSGSNKRIIGPRPELLDEFRKETGRSIWLYNSEDFLRDAKLYDKSGVRDEVIQEISAHLGAQKAAATNMLDSVEQHECDADDEIDLQKPAIDGAKPPPMVEKASPAKPRQGEDDGAGDDD